MTFNCNEGEDCTFLVQEVFEQFIPLSHLTKDYFVLIAIETC